MSRFGVSEKKERQLEAAFVRLGIREADLEENFVRSGGHGGQNVNKVATCVMLAHRPSGISVKVSQERSQAINRFLARRRLADKLEARILGRASAERQRIEKLRRQKRKRSKRAKEKMLSDKRHRSTTKERRGRVSTEEW